LLSSHQPPFFPPPRLSRHHCVGSPIPSAQNRLPAAWFLVQTLHGSAAGPRGQNPGGGVLSLRVLWHIHNAATLPRSLRWAPR
jgi:hypothetical protein